MIGAICALALLPFIKYPTLPATTDAELHIFRLMELSRLVRSGLLYPRWAPDFYFGYGYPIFNYYAPLAYFLGLPFDFLPGVGPVGAVKALFMLSILGGGVGMFAFVRDLFGERAGYAAAAVYVYTPYIQYIDPVARGVLAESLAIGLLPCGLWALNRLRQRPNGLNLVLAVLLTAASLLAHNLMAMIFGGLIAAWVLWSLLFEDLQGAPARTASRWLPLVLVLAVSLSAFFWLPVGLERDAVNLTTLVGDEGSHFSYTSHFLSLQELFASTLRLDWGASEPYYRFNLGVIQYLAGGLGLGLALFDLFRGRNKSLKERLFTLEQPLFFGLAAIILVCLTLPFSRPVWDGVPLLPFLQFPWRLLGPIAAALAVLAGFAAYRLPLAVPALVRPELWIIGLTLFLGAPLSQAPPWPLFGDVNVAALTFQETRGRWLGTTSTADFVPVTVEVLPQREGQMIGMLLQNLDPDRVNYTSLPAESTLTWEQINPLHARYNVASPTEFSLRLFLFDFPGWQVTIDDQPTATELGRPEGFIVIPVPAGSHIIDVRFGSTPARTIAWIISAASLLLTLVIGLRWRPSTSPLTSPLRSTSTPWPVLVVSLAVTAVILLFPGSWLHDESSGFQETPADKTLAANFGEQIRLIGLDLPRERFKPGETIELTLYWHAATDLEINFQSFVHLQAENGILVAQADKLNPGDFPTRRWPLDKYVRDVYKIKLPADIQPGTYRLSAGLWVQAESWRLPLLDESGKQLDDRVVLSEIQITD